MLGPIVDAYEQSIAEAQQTEEALRRELAFTQIELEFERLYRIIYGSQMAALRELAGADPGGVPRQRLHHDYRAARAKWGDVVLPDDPDTWASFLTVADLAELRPDSRNYITPKGKAFLNYVNAKGYPDQPF